MQIYKSLHIFKNHAIDRDLLPRDIVLTLWMQSTLFFLGDIFIKVTMLLDLKNQVSVGRLNTGEISLM